MSRAAASPSRPGRPWAIRAMPWPGILFRFYPTPSPGMVLSCIVPVGSVESYLVLQPTRPGRAEWEPGVVPQDRTRAWLSLSVTVGKIIERGEKLMCKGVRKLRWYSLIQLHHFSHAGLLLCLEGKKLAWYGHWKVPNRCPWGKYLVGICAIYPWNGCGKSNEIWNMLTIELVLWLSSSSNLPSKSLLRN